MAGVEAGRLRKLLEQAQSLIAELRSLDLEQTKTAFPRVFELVRLVNRLQVAANQLPVGQSSDQEAARLSWIQRAQWVIEDTASLAHERVYVSDPKETADRLLLLLFSGADACDRVLREKAELELQLAATRKQATELSQQVSSLSAAQAAARSADQQALEARSQVVVLQQQLAEQGHKATGGAKQIQALMEEVATLRQQLQESRDTQHELQELAESRVQVIQQLMQRAEVKSAESSNIAALRTECETLASGLDANAKVIEKLIQLNEELMDRYNAAAAAKATADAAAALEYDQGLANGSQHAPDTTTITVLQPTSQPNTFPLPVSGPGPPPHIHMNAGSVIDGNRGTPTPPPPLASQPPPSFADAFSRFLADDK